MVNTEKAIRTVDLFKRKRTVSCFEVNDKKSKECFITKTGAEFIAKRSDFVILGKENNKYEQTKKKAAKLVKILSE
nr:hypothetical protein [Sedimentibacter sp.]